MRLLPNKLLGLALVCGALAVPMAVQANPAETPAETNLDPVAAQTETRNARGAELTTVSPEQARANELRRCDRLPDFYKEDCVARVNGQGQVSGSVIGGGLFKETVTTMPKAELEEELKKSQAIQLPALSSD